MSEKENKLSNSHMGIYRFPSNLFKKISEDRWVTSVKILISKNRYFKLDELDSIIIEEVGKVNNPFIFFKKTENAFFYKNKDLNILEIQF